MCMCMYVFIYIIYIYITYRYIYIHICKYQSVYRLAWDAFLRPAVYHFTHFTTHFTAGEPWGLEERGWRDMARLEAGGTFFCFLFLHWIKSPCPILMGVMPLQPGCCSSVAAVAVVAAVAAVGWARSDGALVAAVDGHLTRQHTSAYDSIRQHTSAYVSIRQHTSANGHLTRQHTPAHASIRQHTSAYVSIRAPARQHTWAYVPVAHLRDRDTARAHM